MACKDCKPKQKGRKQIGKAKRATMTISLDEKLKEHIETKKKGGTKFFHFLYEFWADHKDCTKL